MVKTTAANMMDQSSSIGHHDHYQYNDDEISFSKKFFNNQDDYYDCKGHQYTSLKRLSSPTMMTKYSNLFNSNGKNDDYDDNNDDVAVMEYNTDWNSNFLFTNENNKNRYGNLFTHNDFDDLDRLKYQFGIEQQRQRMFESSSSTDVTFDDIEQLSIRIAEHALEING
ncbi:hypothetical protein HUG17_4117 [Dermatophagoides farinae]|nr:hypothetical protein HUG17_4117 [Dermatophagoides farinae]